MWLGLRWVYVRCQLRLFPGCDGWFSVLRGSSGLRLAAFLSVWGNSLSSTYKREAPLCIAVTSLVLLWINVQQTPGTRYTFYPYWLHLIGFKALWEHAGKNKRKNGLCVYPSCVSAQTGPQLLSIPAAACWTMYHHHSGINTRPTPHWCGGATLKRSAVSARRWEETPRCLCCPSDWGRH